MSGLTLAATGVLAPTVTAQEDTATTAWEETAYRGSVEVVDEQDDENTLEGVVFEDTNKNSQRDEGEPGIPGVSVSNGRTIVTTDAEGRYELQVDDNTTVFITQPAGYQVPVDENNVAQFFYNHVPEGSPDLRYSGIEPTGPLPDAVNFPLSPSEGTASPEQNCVIGGDIQTYTAEEVEYARNGAFADLAARDDYANCGALFIGDVVGDDLSLYPDVKELTGMLNGPARFLPGNHDLDFDASDEDHKFDTYRSHFGPEYYSFDVGNAHVVALESVQYPLEDGDGYNGAIDDEQLEWLRQDIAHTPEDKLIVLATHVPLMSFADQGSDVHQIDQVQEIYEIIGDREAIAVSGHTHALANMREGDSLEGWNELYGVEELPFTHIVAGAISGDWYSGETTENGYPQAVGRDGSLPGVLTLDIDGSEVSEFYTVRGEDQSTQMALSLNTPAYRDWYEDNIDNAGEAEEFADPLVVPEDEVAETWLTTNFWMGSTGSTVEVSIDGGEAVAAERTQQMDGEVPNVGAEWSDPAAVQQQLVHGGSVADRAAHIWRLPLPADLGAGEHTAEVTATDVHGHEYTETLTFTVSPVEGGDDNGDDDTEAPSSGLSSLSSNLSSAGSLF
ncbi:calcineurin-like phosphoesterase C-terminal domain-containing protein [Corynebacterium halotolerans]|uniref:Metallophosphoesterase domain-containing protein n=1 Tax=Corynebacterium halotolerans YIM 70093 = DSM 44683 TaxID=1121362 RepID=M1MXG4_9CORY|nr:calcineurin-like phosphoesterase family protein [Corynebacterium halotolerans]AGF72439.1 metallophosphoesterase domain-containing protein [Corynebacterium halotolerans YIM 70093 = DSM 44683]